MARRRRGELTVRSFTALLILVSVVGVIVVVGVTGLPDVGPALPGMDTETPTPTRGPPPYPSTLEEVSITLSTGPCNGGCPIYTVEICGDGTVHYLGYENVNVTGYRERSIPPRGCGNWSIARTRSTSSRSDPITG